MTKFSIIIKHGDKVKARVIGLPRPSAIISLADLERLASVELFLEHLTGFRIHIMEASS